MTDEEYRAFFERLLKKFGGSFDSPSGEGKDTLYFSCRLPPIGDDMHSEQRRIIIDVPIRKDMSLEQRRVIVEKAKKQYGIID